MNISNSSSSLKSKMFRMTVIFQTAVGVGGVQVGAVAKPTSDLPSLDAGTGAGKGKKFDIRYWNRSSAATSVKMESFMGFNIRECMAGLLKKNDAELLASVESNKLKPHWSESRLSSGLAAIRSSSLSEHFRKFYEADFLRFKNGDYVFWLTDDDDDDGVVAWGKVIAMYKSSNLLKVQFGDRVTFTIHNHAKDDGSLFTAYEARRFAGRPGWTGLCEAIYESGVEELELLLARASAEIM